MNFKKISWIFKRHPFLYMARFKLLSKNSNVSEIASFSYNSKNSKDDIPKLFFEINEKIFKEFEPSSQLERVKYLSTWLHNNIKGGPGLSEPSEIALSTMLAGKGGVCSDMAQIFNNFCVINDIEVREWGNTRAPFDKDYGGHSFNEIYLADQGKWVLIDVSSSLMFYHQNELLSVVELYDLLRSKKEIQFESFNDQKQLDEKSIKRKEFLSWIHSY